MSAAKKLALIALGYTLSVAAGVALVAVHELVVGQNSDGMAAFGDMILFVLATGFFSLAPTWFLLKLSIEKAPRALLAALLLVAALGPLSWLAVAYLSDAQAADEPFGLLITFVAMPRIVAGPVLLVVEATAFLLTRARATRVLLAAAMMMDLVSLGIFALHLAAAIHR
jgi:hypothetical protein